ncbi:hypothetical protein ACR6C2_34190 [Streptomyces sp. INA 01156]
MLGGEPAQVVELALLHLDEEVVTLVAGRDRSDSVVLMRCRSPAVKASMLRPLVLGRGSMARRRAVRKGRSRLRWMTGAARPGAAASDTRSALRETD